MLTRSQLLAALGHNDFFIRNTVLSLLREDLAPGHDITRQAILTTDRYGWKNAWEYNHIITSHPLDEEAAAWVLRQLNEEGGLAAEEHTKGHLTEWFSTAPIGVLRTQLDAFTQYHARICQTPGELSVVVNNSLVLAQTRLRLADTLDADCWLAVESCLEECLSTEAFPKTAVRQLELLAERLASTRSLSEETINQWLANDYTTSESSAHWRQGLPFSWPATCAASRPWIASWICSITIGIGGMAASRLLSPHRSEGAAE